ncbi:MAG TPA: undecaprenyl-phosphate galactose phosphotransferase WbaP [Desulfotomaculum sp.]|nr:undecaprenyl-phosphate galactose phosphotransferase WbaP [Desulfotomaculum sp.]
MTAVGGQAEPAEHFPSHASTSDLSLTRPPFERVGDRLAAQAVHLAAPCSLVLVDTAALAVSIGLALLLRVHVLPVLWPVFPPALPENLNIWWLPAVGVLCLGASGLYTKRLSFWRECEYLVKAVTFAFLITLAVVSLAKISHEVSRTVIVLAWLISLATVPLCRWAGKSLLARTGIWRRRVLVFGAGKTGELVAAALTRDRYLGYEICGFLEDDPAKRGGVRVNGRHFPVLGGFRDSDRVMAETGAYDLIVAAPGMPPDQLVGLVNRLHRRAASVQVVPDLFGMPAVGAEADYLFQEKTLVLRVKNNLASPLNRLVKRVFDLLTGGVLLAVLAPLLAVLALAVKLDSPGPVLFRHRRIGHRGKEFKCYKFRTMVINAEVFLQEHLKKNPTLRREWERNFKLKNDPRVTRVGRFLRTTSLDELPQIFNVLKGEMSLVGPRPIVRDEVPRVGPYINDFYLIRPGITGLWQVSGRNDIDYAERVRLEAWYVHNWSLWLDITLLIRTLAVVFSRRGAY